jgi:hypothetical protein
VAGEIAAGIAALRAATDIVGGLIAARDMHKFSGALIELQNKIISANLGISALQDQLSTSKDEKRDLEDKLRDIENWRAETERYELRDFGTNIYAYTLKQGFENGEPPHHICATCLPQRQKSILQCLTTDGYYQCNVCKNGFQLGEKATRRLAVRSSGTDGGWMGA